MKEADMLDGFFDRRFITDVRLSPDNESVCFVVRSVDRDRDNYSHSIHLRPFVGDQSGEEVVKDGRLPRWSPDSEALAFHRDGERAGIYVWDVVERSERLVVAVADVGEIEWSPNGRSLAFTAPVRAQRASLPIEVDHIAHRRDGRGLHPAMYQLHVIDIVGGAARLLSTEEADVSTPMWSPDGTTIAARVGSHPIEPSELVLYNEEGLRRSVIPAGWTCTSVCWHGSGNSLVFAGQSRARYSRHQQLFTVTLDGARPRRLASNLDRNVLSGACGYLGIRPTIESGLVYFTAREGGHIRLFVADLAGGPAVLASGAEGLSVRAGSVGANRMALIAEDHASSGDIHLVDRGSSWRVTHIEQIAAGDIFLPERIEVESPDGTPIEGWVWYPRNATGPTPLLLEIHGGPHSAFGPSLDSDGFHRIELLKRGWSILKVNPRGSDGYGERFMGAAVGRWGEADMPDLEAAVDFLVQRGRVDAGRVAVTGYSYGGFMTNWIIANTSRFTAAVTGGSICDLISFYGTAEQTLLVTDEVGASPSTDLEAYIARSPLFSSERVTTPTLILHGVDDQACPVGQAEQWYAALKYTGVPCGLVLYPNASHGLPFDGRPTHIVDYGRRLVEWVTRFTPVVGSQVSE